MLPAIDRHGLDVGLLLTHFARADEVGHDFNATQLEQVMAVFRLLQERPKLRLSFGNSAACAGVFPVDVAHLVGPELASMVETLRREQPQMWGDASGQGAWSSLTATRNRSRIAGGYGSTMWRPVQNV